LTYLNLEPKAAVGTGATVVGQGLAKVGCATVTARLDETAVLVCMGVVVRTLLLLSDVTLLLSVK